MLDLHVLVYATKRRTLRFSGERFHAIFASPLKQLSRSTESVASACYPAHGKNRSRLPSEIVGEQTPLAIFVSDCDVSPFGKYFAKDYFDYCGFEIFVVSHKFRRDIFLARIEILEH